MKVKAYAKINLALDVLKKRDDGYHDVSMIMQTISLCDVLDINPIYEEGKTTTRTNCDEIPDMEKNIAHKAALAFFEKTNLKYSADIFIKKNIPHSAGLAGGSADAAAVLLTLNDIFKTKLSKDELCKIGSTLGADVPFCILKGTFLAEGIGDILTPLPSFKDHSLLIIKPPFDVSTPEVYKNLKLTKSTVHPPIEDIIDALTKDDYKFIFENSSNVLESVTAKKHKDIEKIKSELKDFGASLALMSGSGPSVFGIFKNDKKIIEAYNHFKNIYSDTFITKTICNV
ncbi:MAG: 4-(cytidine 5'-diphospho)-2-C-methyl-D-erythritol kinase [Ruminococcaceae bacterium]|nr:4-(cytidine 5'-diphospho)-2-C-methyl-D-erythritol kinase [Oscillospiraceae bacterium]